MKKGTHNIKLRSALVYLTAAVCAGLATPSISQEGPGVSESEIKLGSWAPLTGTFAPAGIPSDAGAKAFFGLLNDRGGVGGRKIKLITEDSAYNPQKTVAAARKLVDSDQVLAIHGAYGTGPSAATFQFLQSKEVPFVMPYGGALDWFSPPKPGVIGAQVLYEDQARVLGRWAALEGYKKIAIVHGAAAAFEKVAAQVLPGAKTVSADATVEMFPVKLGTADYVPVALQLISFQPDAVIFFSTADELAALAKSLQQQGSKIPLFTYAPCVTNSLAEIAGEAANGIRATSWTLPITSDAPAVREYRDALAKYAPGEKPDYNSLFTFALAKITAEAIAQADEPLNRQNLIKGFFKLRDYETGIIPAVSLTPENPIGASQVQRVVMTNGKWEAVGQFVETKSLW